MLVLVVFNKALILFVYHLFQKEEHGTITGLNSVGLMLILIKQPNICLLYLNVDVRE